MSGGIGGGVSGGFTKVNGAYPENSNNNNNTSNNIYQQLGAHNSKSINEINLAEVRNALDRRTMSSSNSQTNNVGQNNNAPVSKPMVCGGSAEIIFDSNFSSSSAASATNNHGNQMTSSNSNENLLDIYNGNAGGINKNDLYKQTPSISANGALVPPPYRDPPPPRNSPLQQQLNNGGSQISTNLPGSNAIYSNQQPANSAYQSQDYDFVDYQQISDLVLPTSMDESESIFQATQYNDLLQLIKFQREKINQQQLELTKVSHLFI